MASVTRRLVLSTSSRCSRSITPRAIAPPQQQWHRSLSSTVPRYDDAGKKPDASDSKPVEGPKKHDSKPEIIQKDPLLTTVEPATTQPDIKADVVRDDRTMRAPIKKPKKAVPKLEKQPKPPKPTEDEVTAAQLKTLMDSLGMLDEESVAEARQKGELGMGWQHGGEKLERDEDFEFSTKIEGKLGFWAEGEESLGPDEDYYGDDITSDGHGLLEEQRDLRKYARLIAWELPLLNQLAKPFELPTAATPFRFRYTSYLGEKHPATNKVVVEFCASDMPNLTDVQKSKLIKLAGPRYNPDTDIIKMSCELFDTLPQNKRFLGDTISKLLAEARNPADTFEDVPFDFRHHKPKKRHLWPEKWNLTPERKRELEERRAKGLLMDREREMKGTLVDGTRAIEAALPFGAPVQEPVMVGSGARRLR